jgi:phosphoglycerate dehydrogenase-like enzyme
MPLDVLCLRPEADFARVDELPSPRLRVAYMKPDDDSVPELLGQARALVIPAVGSKLPASLFDTAPLALVQVTGAGVDRLDAEALKARGIPVANVPGGSNNAVAEYAVTAASLLLRRFAWADGEVRRGQYAEVRARMLAENVGGLEDLTVGLVGMGVIGAAVARAFVLQGCRVHYFDPALPAADEPADATRIATLHELLAAADVISLHVPLLPSTRGLIGAEQLAVMKRGAILIQAARGGVVNEAALAASLGSGHLGGAAVDVYSTEPPPADNPLLALDGEAARRLLLTPHIAGVTRQSAAKLFRACWANVERVLLDGEPPRHRVY